jgi:lactoylglutathione lyase
MKLNLAEFTEQVGIIPFVEKFYECEKFYAETIGLRILYRKELLTAFEFGNGYLMLEVESSETRRAARGSFVIRFNVRDLVGASNHLKLQGIDVVIYDFDWGSMPDACFPSWTIAAFTDPDGNRCELKTPVGRAPT